MNHWIFHHPSSFLMTLGPSSSAFVSFLGYRWLFNVATPFVNGPLSDNDDVLEEYFEKEVKSEVDSDTDHD